jgi:ATP-binding cassette subfamily B protein
VVLITHRLAATASADHIYVLDHGHIAEHGTHDRLMGRSGGLYRGMFDAQAAQYGLTPPPAANIPSPRDGAAAQH